jgi:signal peptidase I
MLALIYLIALSLVSVLVAALALYLAAKLFRAPTATFGRAIAGVLLQTVVGLSVAAALQWLRNSPSAFTMLLIGATIVIGVGIWTNCAMFGLSTLRASGAWLVFMVLQMALAAPLAWSFRTYVAEGFAAAGNAMAPSLVGVHRVGVCPHCGGQLILAGHDGESPLGPFGGMDQVQGICRHCRREAAYSPGSDGSSKPVIGDRFLVEKHRSPQRWDLLVYRANNEPRVSRLVGMPGESIELRNGEIWIDGQQATYAPEMVGLTYQPAIASDHPQHSLYEDQTVQLAADEFFVLGDFSAIAKDSRYDGPVHQPELVGIATLIYWPPERFRIVR